MFVAIAIFASPLVVCMHIAHLNSPYVLPRWTSLPASLAFHITHGPGQLFRFPSPRTILLTLFCFPARLRCHSSPPPHTSILVPLFSISCFFPSFFSLSISILFPFSQRWIGKATTRLDTLAILFLEYYVLVLTHIYHPFPPPCIERKFVNWIMSFGCALVRLTYVYVR